LIGDRMKVAPIDFACCTLITKMSTKTNQTVVDATKHDICPIKVNIVKFIPNYIQVSDFLFVWPIYQNNPPPGAKTRSHVSHGHMVEGIIIYGSVVYDTIGTFN